jgi:hypothetical protein
MILDTNRYAQMCTDIIIYALIYTDLSGYVPYMHRYGHIWVDPGLILEPVDVIHRYNHMNRYTPMNRYELI